MKLDLLAVGLSMPGLAGWVASQAVLRGEQAHALAELPPSAMTLLPANERRRAPPTVRLAFAAAEDAVDNGGLQPAEWATVFVTSEADTPIIHRICHALAEPARLVSPTDFHNCVHNAAAGYWSIAAGCRLPSSSLSAWDLSFTAGLLEAGALALVEELPVLLVAYDLPPPVPLYASRKIAQPAALALALRAPGNGPALARLHLQRGGADDAESRCADVSLEALRLSNPAARALPLLVALAQGRGSVVLPAVGGTLRVELS